MWQEADSPGFLYRRTNERGLQTEEFPITNHFRLEVEAFGQAVLTGQPAPYPLSDSAANVRVCQAILQSIKEKRVVEL
jgi:predicted dehydrogenase